VSAQLRIFAGGFFGGKRLQLTPSIQMRFRDTISGELGVSRNDINLPGGNFHTNLVRARISYSFTPRVAIQALLQYNDQQDFWSSNLRFSWLHRGNTGLFIVYNDMRGLNDSPLLRPDRSLTVKLSRTLRPLN
jgi:hypothetical protein